MKEPLYRQAIQQSWKLAWQHKILWIFGLFAALIGQLGVMDLLSKVGMAANNNPMYNWGLTSWSYFKFLFTGGWHMGLSPDGWVWYVCLLLIILGFTAFFIFTAVVSQGALIRVSANFAKHKKLPDESEAWHAGVRHFWRLFFINAIRKVLFCLLALLVSWFTVKLLFTISAGSALLFLILFVVSAFVGIILSFLTIYASAYVVVEEYKIIEAIVSAWKLFTSHFIVSLEVALIVVLLNIVLAVVVLLGFMVTFLPTLVSWVIASKTFNISLLFAGMMFGTAISTLFIVFVASVFTVFNTSVWTYLFVKMHHEGIKSRILHWWGHIKK